jgi:hypothetical protein
LQRARPAAQKKALTEPAGLSAEQDDDTGRNGEDRHDHGQTLKVEMQQWYQPGHDEPNAQQHHPQVLWQSKLFHFVDLLFLPLIARRGARNLPPSPPVVAAAPAEQEDQHDDDDDECRGAHSRYLPLLC